MKAVGGQLLRTWAGLAVEHSGLVYSPLDVLQQLPRELVLAEEPCGLKRGRRACQRIGIRAQEQFDDRGLVLEDGACQRGLPSIVVSINVGPARDQCGDRQLVS